ncbi:MAG: hypothetical protein HY216_04875 [Candidatus Rokubacteria bacterium]|nr:hypothetical protein [Candidatus Rokubacteria bacterium]
MNERDRETSDEALSRRLADELPRYSAPARLRVAIVDALPDTAPRRSRWLAPTLAALATALVLVLVFVPLLPRIVPADPAERLVRAVVSEHTRTLMWGPRRLDVVPVALPWVTQEAGIELSRVFSGDASMRLESAEPVYLEQRRGIALHYRDEDGHLLTYVVLPAPGLPLPERKRQQVGRFRPALVHESGFSAWVWKQGDLACFLVADMVSESDIDQFKDYFVRVRVATEPVPAY